MRKHFWWNDEFFVNGGLSLKCVGELAERVSVDSGGRPGPYPFWLINFTYKNHGEIRLGGPGGAWLPRTPGMVQLVRANTAYDCRNTCGIDGHWAYVGFHSGETMNLNQLVDASGVACFRDPEFLIGHRLALAADLTRQMGECSYWKVMGVLCEILGLLHAATPREDGVSLIGGWERITPEEAPLVRDVRNFLSNNLNRHVRLREIAAAAGVSVSWLTHDYAACAGETPQATHMRLRLDLACELLIRGEPIKQVASLVGFSSVHHFSSAFKAKRGLPPAQFRAKHQPPL